MNPMKLAVLMLALAPFAVAQQPPANQAPAGQQSTSGTPQAGTAATPQAGAATTPATGKLPPQAKTQAEFDAYNAAKASGSDPAALEKAADDFATKYPDSELKILLYRDAMHAYQSANNADKMLEMGRKVLAIDPNDPEALIGVAEVLTERTRDTDLDKDQRLAEAQQSAEKAVQTIDTDVAVPAGTPQDKVDAYKGFLRSSAYAILGTLQFKQDKFKEAEDDFRKSLAVYPAQPDPVVVLRLALALDKQGRYPDALKEANHAVELTQEGTTAGTLARRERDRLVQLTGGTAPAGANPSGMANPAPSGTAPVPTNPATPKQ